MESIVATTDRSRLWNGFWQLADPKIWLASLVPFAVGTTVAAAQGIELEWLLIWIAVGALILVETGKNGLNEYYDYLSGADSFVLPKDRTPFSGGKKVVVDHLLSLREVKWITLLCMIGALIVSLPLVVNRPRIAWFGIAGVFFSVAYSLPPLHLSYRGLGEAVVGLTFGPVVLNGAYFLQSGALHPEPLLLSIPLAFLIANVLVINEVPDVEADRKAKKWNLVARAGRRRAIILYAALFILAAFAIAVAAIVLNNAVYLIGLLGLLPGAGAVRHARKYCNDTQQLMKANARTIQIYILTGLLLAVSALLRFEFF